ncbi:MAG: DUF4332 domain-containing protein [Candidatus Hermodarchaeota archaeon]
MIENTALYKTVEKYKVNGTHRWITMQALCLLPEDWGRVFLRHSKLLLKGSKMPDDTFKDFRNHVFHPPNWGGAPSETQRRAELMNQLIKEKNFSRLVLEAGILSHYVADVLNPMHTGQTEKEKLMHKFFEWGNHKYLNRHQQRMSIRATGKLESVKDIPAMVKENGTYSHQFYVYVVDGYDMEKGKVEAQEGMNEEILDTAQDLLERAINSVARIWWTAIQGVTVPEVSLTIPTIVTRLAIPIHLYKKRVEERRNKKILARMLKEYERHGKVERTLDTDEKWQTRALKEIQDEQGTTPQLRAKPKPRIEPKAKPKPKPKATKGHLALKDDVEDAPEIGKKTAERLYAINIKTVQDLMEANPADIVSQLDVSWLKADDVKRWQEECQLMLDIKVLYGHDAQILWNCGYKTKQQVASANPSKLLNEAIEFAKSKQGERIISEKSMPTQEEVEMWINSVKE